MTSPAITTIPLGASIYRFEVDGKNIVLSYPDPALHKTLPHPFFGETIGRVANRIANATIPNLNGQSYQLNANNGPNTLHGGSVGWGKAVWKGPTHIRRGAWDAGVTEVAPPGWTEPAGGGSGRAGIRYDHLSPDGDEHFPGSVQASVWYFEGRDTAGKVVFDSEYEARFAEDAAGVEETVVGMTNHRYVHASSTEASDPDDVSATSISTPARSARLQTSRLTTCCFPPPSIRRYPPTRAFPTARSRRTRTCSR